MKPLAPQIKCFCFALGLAIFADLNGNWWEIGSAPVYSETSSAESLQTF